MMCPITAREIAALALGAIVGCILNHPAPCRKACCVDDAARERARARPSALERRPRSRTAPTLDARALTCYDLSAEWRRGSAFGSYPKGRPFESGLRNAM